MLMTMEQLRDYNCWIGKKPLVIFENVIRLGGWRMVFTGRLPRWASKVRNFFNRTPTTLTRLQPDAEKKMAKAVQRLKGEMECEEERQRQEDNKWVRTPQDRINFPHGNKPNPNPIVLPGHCPKKPSEAVTDIGPFDAIALRNTLSGQVYRDETGRHWYQMSAGATIFHWGAPVNPLTMKAEAAITEKIRGQNDTPVFKMISPDRTGGSREIIIKNRGTDYLVPAGASIRIINNMVVYDEVYQGSYNYADAMIAGFAAHKALDIEPHIGASDFYVNPAHRYWDLDVATFPIKDPRFPNRKPLAEEV